MEVCALPVQTLLQWVAVFIAFVNQIILYLTKMRFAFLRIQKCLLMGGLDSGVGSDLVSL